VYCCSITCISGNVNHNPNPDSHLTITINEHNTTFPENQYYTVEVGTFIKYAGSFPLDLSSLKLFRE